MALMLHVGCGNDIKAGYINVDEYNSRADLRCSVQKLTYPANSIERIEGYMVLEHLTPSDARAFMRNAFQMLLPRGKLILEVPDMVKVCRLIPIFDSDPDYLESGAFGLRGIFGQPTPKMTLGDYHKWGYTPTLMRKLLSEAGFRVVDFSDGNSHYYPLRDMRAEATKT